MRVGPDKSGDKLCVADDSESRPVVKAGHGHTKSVSEIVKTMGLVFGDIGTSPIYTITVIFLLLAPTAENVFGVISLVFWTLVALIGGEYAWLAMGLSKRGEGGDIVMREILLPMLNSSRKIGFYTILTFISISLLIGDGVITPAISILSAVEGTALIPGFGGIQVWEIVLIACVIAIGLFAFQKRGSDRVAKYFGPIMVVWFGMLAISGAMSLAGDLSILKSLNPLYGLGFLFNNGIAGFFILSQVILCATGGEALYAGMGHMSKRSIRRGWMIVFFALILNYLGQGVFAMQNPEADNVFFGMLSSQSGIFYVPLLVLALMATVIASQAMISSMFSVVYQGITTGLLPKLKVDYTSAKLRSQIYIPFVNWALLLMVLFVMFEFKSSSSLANAYGLAVTGSMAITGILMTTIFYLRKGYVKMLFALAVTLADFTYLFSCGMRIPYGGYWSLVIASVPLALILIYYAGQKRLHRAMMPIPLGYFLRRYEALYQSANRIPGTALYFVKEIGAIPQYMARVIFDNRIVYDENIIISISQKDEPYGICYGFDPPLATGLKHFAIEFGYMEALNVENILRIAGISERAIFYGLEEIQTDNAVWKVFASIKRITPSTVRFYKLPIEKLHGVMMRVDLRVKQ